MGSEYTSSAHHFAKSFLWGFGLTLVMVSLGVRTCWAIWRTPFSASLKSIPHFDDKNPSVAKSNRHLWLQPGAKDWLGGTGVSPHAFREVVLPGYSPHEINEEFWHNYFHLHMTPGMFWVAPEEKDRAYLLSGSSLGALQAFDKWGADIVVLGSSEMYRHFIPSQFAKELAAWDSKEVPKTLTVSTLNRNWAFMSEDLHQALLKMKRSGKKASLVVWCFSLNQAYASPFLVSETSQSQWDVMKRWKDRLQWEDVFPFKLNHARDTLIAEATRWNKPWWILGSLPEEPVAYFSAPVAKDEMALTQLFSQLPVSRHLFNGSCDLADFRQRVARISELASEVSDRMLIYWSPTPPRRQEAFQGCDFNKVAQILSELRSPRIQIELEPWTDFGIGYRDFVFESETPGAFWLSSNHTNYEGARKVTHHLARLVAKNQNIDDKLP